jgi:hypothetical protein
MRRPPTSDLDQRREEQLELVHARQKSQAKASHIAISPSTDTPRSATCSDAADLSQCTTTRSQFLVEQSAACERAVVCGRDRCGERAADRAVVRGRAITVFLIGNQGNRVRNDSSPHAAT